MVHHEPSNDLNLMQPAILVNLETPIRDSNAAVLRNRCRFIRPGKTKFAFSYLQKLDLFVPQEIRFPNAYSLCV
jgi:hypothetical protein